MSVFFRSNQNIAVATVTGILDAAQGQILVSEVNARVPKGGKLIIDGIALTGLTPEGLTHLITVQEWSSNPERRRLRLAGFGPGLWQVIVNQGREILFEATDALPDALDSLGIEETASLMGNFGSIGSIGDVDAAATVVGLRRPPRTPVVPPSAAATVTPPTVVPVPPPTSISITPPTRVTRPPPPPPLLPVKAAAPAPSLPPPVAAAPLAAAPGYPPPGAGGGSKALLFGALAVAALLLLVVAVAGAAWLFLGQGLPAVAISAPRVVAEEDGKEVDEVSLEVRRGKLLEESWRGLPAGLYFEAANEGDSNNSYLLRGKAENGARNATVQLEAVDGKGRHSPPVPFTVEVKEKPLSWQLATLLSLNLQSGSPVAGESKFVTGAAAQPVATGLPPGLRVELAPGTARDWQLAGTPRQAGGFAVAFKAATASGASQEKPCTLQVAEAPGPAVSAAPVPLAPRPTPAPAPARAATAGGTGDGAPAPLAGGMREFLLKRIEKLPSRYSDDEREDLRDAVNELKQSRVVAQISFERPGQTKVSAEQAARLKAALGAPAVQELLKDPGCQVAIVGYASKKGSLAGNVRISKERARNVNELFDQAQGRDADLCGDYGPTDVVDQSSDQANQVVEVYAGVMELSPGLRAKAAKFRSDFNYRHGLH